VITPKNQVDHRRHDCRTTWLRFGVDRRTELHRLNRNSAAGRCIVRFDVNDPAPARETATDGGQETET